MLRDGGVYARLAPCLNSVLNVKALIGAFNQEKALVGPSFEALVSMYVSIGSIGSMYHCIPVPLYFLARARGHMSNSCW